MQCMACFFPTKTSFFLMIQMRSNFGVKSIFIAFKMLNNIVHKKIAISFFSSSNYQNPCRKRNEIANDYDAILLLHAIDTTQQTIIYSKRNESFE